MMPDFLGGRLAGRLNGLPPPQIGICGREGVRVAGYETPGSVVAHVKSSYVESSQVNVSSFLDNFVDESFEGLSPPPAIFLALRGNDNCPLEFFELGDEFGGTVLRYFFESIAAFAVTVEEEKERSSLGWFLARG